VERRDKVFGMKAKKPPKQKAVYYAHAMCIYGELDERRELIHIRRQLPRTKIVNPASYSGHPLKLADTMGFCLKLVEKSDIVVFSRLLGKITAGVGKEVNHALKIGKPVFELTQGKLVARVRKVTYVSRSATINLYNKYRQGLFG
jgi:hypothetical protein